MPKKSTPVPIFYRNSLIVDEGGCMIAQGAINTAWVENIQEQLPDGAMLIVVDLNDTWIRPFRNDDHRLTLMRKVFAGRSPFLITKDSIFTVGHLNGFRRLKFTVGDLEIRLIAPEEAEVMLTANNHYQQALPLY